MTKEQMAEIVQANMRKIYLYCVRSLGNAAEAEDVASDIILELLRSSPRVKNDEAVYGYLWAVAANLCRNYRRKAGRYGMAEISENCAAPYLITPEETVIRRQEISALRRELSFLSEKYRAVMTAFYIDSKSCESIAQQMHMSVTNVKQYLFEGRKKVREGMDKQREYGVYSYAPEKFTMNFWGSSADGYWQLFERKLPGSIMLSVFDKPKTMEELSQDVGVAMPYLEEEVARLEEYKLLVMKGRRYHCGIVIYDRSFTEKVNEAAGPALRGKLPCIMAAVDKGRALLKDTDYRRLQDDDNTRGWFILMLICWEALQRSESKMKTRLTFPLLENGSNGYVMGMRGEIPSGISGIYGRYALRHDYVRILNFNLATDTVINPFAKGVRDVLCACEAGLEENTELEALPDMLEKKIVYIRGGKICSGFSEISEKSYFFLMEQLKDEIDEMSSVAACLRDQGADLLAQSMPESIPHVHEVGSIVSMWSLMENIVPAIMENGFLSRGLDGQNPTAFYIKT